MSSLKYKKYLLSIDWKNKREEVLKINLYKCQRCNNTTHLNIHHWTYKRLYNENLSDLFCICSECHNEFHKLYWFKSLLKTTKLFIENKPIDISTTTRIKKVRISRKQANNFIPTDEFILYVRLWWKYKWNTFTNSLRLWNSVVRRYKELQDGEPLGEPS